MLTSDIIHKVIPIVLNPYNSECVQVNNMCIKTLWITDISVVLLEKMPISIKERQKKMYLLSTAEICTVLVFKREHCQLEWRWKNDRTERHLVYYNHNDNSQILCDAAETDQCSRHLENGDGVMKDTSLTEIRTCLNVSRVSKTLEDHEAKLKKILTL